MLKCIAFFLCVCLSLSHTYIHILVRLTQHIHTHTHTTGKTTTINMLTGLFPPDAGNSGTTVYGKSISNDIDSIRDFLGVCPQHDVLIPSLTSHEHCIFFAMLKGSSYENAKSEASQLLSDFHLMKRKDHFGHMLSGGMRRKLSTIVALCGNSKFVILDEPSSGTYVCVSLSNIS